MCKIAFFCIPAYGHINPTLEVVRELTKRGCRVRYFSYENFREKIEQTGAEFVGCDQYDVQEADPREAARVGKDIGYSMKLLVNTTLALDEMVCASMKEWKPDCIVADSMAVWGKFAALKLGIPFLSSTTTFAFNRYSSKIMKQDVSQLFALLKALPGVQKDLKRLREKGYPVKNMLSILGNDNDIHTIVYTSPEFQPCAETFSEKYTFVGPSLPLAFGRSTDGSGRKLVYISMGTVNNRLPDFYKNCVEALKDSSYDVIMSIGKGNDAKALLGEWPGNFRVEEYVNQTEVLRSADVFLSHCGMNSVNESLYYEVPLVLFPQTAEQGGVANRVAQLGAGSFLKENSPEAIRKAIDTVLQDDSYRENAVKISESFQRAGGSVRAAEVILKVIGKEEKNGAS